MKFSPGRSSAAFSAARAAGRAALVGFLHIGFPDVPASISALQTLVNPGGGRRGVDVVEIGLPYSDPVLDGPVNSYASEVALRRGVRTRDVFAGVEAVAAAGAVPLVMTYWNLVERYGVDAFAADLKAAGGAGLITPDLPPDEGAEWIAASDRHDLDRIFLVAPSSTDARLQNAVDHCRGWVYAAALMGVTGARAAVSAAAPTLVKRIRSYDSGALTGVGLGVSNAAQAAEVAEFSDAVIVGSALVRTVIAAAERGDSDFSELGDLTAALAAGVAAAGTSQPQ